MLQFNPRGLEFKTSEQCERFQMMAFGISCATCGRSDEECPWRRQNEPTMVAVLPNPHAMAAVA